MIFDVNRRLLIRQSFADFIKRSLCYVRDESFYYRCFQWGRRGASQTTSEAGHLVWGIARRDELLKNAI